MKKTTMLVFVAVVGLTALSAPKTIKEIMKTPVKDLTPEEYALRTAHVREVKLKIFGGDVVKPGSQKGKIVFLNSQKKLDKSEIEAAVGTLHKSAKFNFEIHSLEMDNAFSMPSVKAMCDKFNAPVTVVLIDNSDAPTTLIAPEERWALVNIGKLSEGLKSGPLYSRMFAARCRKQIIRTFSLLCGGGSSQFPGNMMATASVKDLDTVQEFIPIDMGARWTDYLKNLGVTPAYQRTYKQACVEGWAPAPTNEYQKAIWDRIHATPKNPMKIEFDPKKGR